MMLFSWGEVCERVLEIRARVVESRETRERGFVRKLEGQK